MSSLEAQLLAIIEEQQQQLKKQQQQQEEALKLIQKQSLTIAELEKYILLLKENNSQTVEVAKKYKSLVEKLSKQTISEHFSQILQDDLARDLKAHVMKLVSSLDLEKESKALLNQILPSLVQTEIEKQTKPLSEILEKKLGSVESYQKKLHDLTQHLSSQL